VQGTAVKVHQAVDSEGNVFAVKKFFKPRNEQFKKFIVRDMQSLRGITHVSGTVLYNQEER